MNRISTVKPKFVEFIPETLEDGVLYVSMPYGTASHRCCCGCGTPVVTPITPTDWTLTFDGRSVSLSPSVGSSALPCKSHYFIRANQIVWAPPMTKELTEYSRSRERQRKNQHFAPTPAPTPPVPPPAPTPLSAWERLKRWMSGSN